MALAEKGVFVSVVDFSEEKGKETTSLVQKANAPFHPSLNSPSAIFIKCDVTNRGSKACVLLLCLVFCIDSLEHESR